MPFEGSSTLEEIMKPDSRTQAFVCVDETEKLDLKLQNHVHLLTDDYSQPLIHCKLLKEWNVLSIHGMARLKSAVLVYVCLYMCVCVQVFEGAKSRGKYCN
jgi:hypothetical protein